MLLMNWGCRARRQGSFKTAPSGRDEAGALTAPGFVHLERLQVASLAERRRL